jgi:ethanolaminephosphotransferase
LNINWKNNEHATFYLIDCATPISLFWLLIEKVENAPLIVLILLQMYCLAHILGYFVERQKFSNMDIHAACYYFGMATFYYFGRNISISSVDFSVAYQGLSSYQPTLIGSIVFLEIYLPKIFFSILIPIYTTIKLQKYEEKFSELPLNGIFSFIFGIQSIQLLVNSCMLYLMRDHLFIWSVFSPKFLWVIGDWLALCLLFLILSLLQVHYHLQQKYCVYYSEK